MDSAGVGHRPAITSCSWPGPTRTTAARSGRSTPTAAGSTSCLSRRHAGGAYADPRSIACFWPGWSPDGTKIVFTRLTSHGTQSNIAIVNADGSGLVQITNTGDADEADWGTHPLG